MDEFLSRRIQMKGEKPEMTRWKLFKTVTITAGVAADQYITLLSAGEVDFDSISEMLISVYDPGSNPAPGGIYMNFWGNQLVDVNFQTFETYSMWMLQFNEDGDLLTIRKSTKTGQNHPTDIAVSDSVFSGTIRTVNRNNPLTVRNTSYSSTPMAEGATYTFYVR